MFGDWQADIDYQKWWRSLGVNPPGDYTDPELLFDQLPQPYRTITKVLEQDILDASWDILTDRHPELLLVQPENHTGPLLELENIVEPPVTSTTAGAVTAVRTIGTSSGGGSSDYNSPFASLVIAGSSSGRVAILDAAGAVVSSLVVGEVLATAAVAGIDGGLLGGKGSGVTALSSASDDPMHPLRFAAVLANLTVQPPGASANDEGSVGEGSKGKGGKAGDEAGSSSSTVSSTLVLFELWPVLQAKDENDGPTMPGGNGGAGGEVSNGGVGGEVGLEGVEVARPRLVLVSASTFTEPTAVVEVSLAPDGLFLSTAFADGRLKVFALPPRPVLPTVSDDDEAGKMEKIPEEVEANDGDAAAALFGGTERITPFYPPIAVLPPPPPPTYAAPPRGADAAAASEPAGHPAFWSRDLMGNCIFLQAASIGPGMSDVGPERDHLATTAFAVWRRGSNVLRKYRLPAPVTTAAISSAATAAADAAEGAEGTPPDDLAAAVEAAAAAAANQVMVLGEFAFGGEITALAISPANSRGLGQTTQLLGVAAIGTAHGSVFLWDLNAGTTRAVLGAHHSAITSLIFHQGSRLFTGSADGVLHAYELFPPALTAAQQAQQLQNAKDQGGNQNNASEGAAAPALLQENFDDGSGYMAPRLLKVVWHIKEALVWMASTAAAPLLYAQGVSGKVVVYDLADVTLLGECARA